MPDRIEITYQVEKNAKVNFNLQDALRRAGRYMVSSTQRKITRGSFTPISPLTQNLRTGNIGKPLRDTGALLSSISSRVEGDSVIIGTNRAGARINNYGGTITAKNRTGYLWIPANREMKQKLLSVGGSISRLIRLYRSGGFYCRRCGNAFMAFKKGEKPVMLFILKKSIKIPSRPFFYIDDDDDKVIRRMFHVIERSAGSDQDNPQG